MCYSASMKQRGFTIVELIVVIVVIAALAALAIFSFGAWRERTSQTEVKDALVHAAAAMNDTKNFTNTYPTTIPASYAAPSGVVLQLVVASGGTDFCINGYSTTTTSVALSVNSSAVTSTTLCNGVTTTVVGGTVPAIPKNTKMALDFSNWTLTGTASYNAANGILTLGTNGSASSPPVRVTGGTVMSFGGDVYATQQSPDTSVPIQPNACFQGSFFYYASDGVTPRMNTWNYTSNGAFGRFTPSTLWVTNEMYAIALGNGIEYVRLGIASSASGFSSPDLRVKNPYYVVV